MPVRPRCGLEEDGVQKQGGDKTIHRFRRCLPLFKLSLNPHPNLFGASSALAECLLQKLGGNGKLSLGNFIWTLVCFSPISPPLHSECRADRSHVPFSAEQL